MKIKIKTFGDLRIKLNGKSEIVLDVKNGQSIGEIMKAYELDTKNVMSVVKDNKIYDFSYQPRDGDEFVLVPFIAGG